MNIFSWLKVIALMYLMHNVAVTCLLIDRFLKTVGLEFKMANILYLSGVTASSLLTGLFLKTVVWEFKMATLLYRSDLSVVMGQFHINIGI